MAASAHAGFAASTLISEALVNRCLATYLASNLDDEHATWAWTAPVVVNGAALSFSISANAILISMRATLRRNATGRVALTARFYATSTLTVSQGSTVIDSYMPEAVIQASLTVSLIAQNSGGQFQFGVGLQNSSVDSLQAQVVGGLPAVYVRTIVDALKRLARSPIYARHPVP